MVVNPGTLSGYKIILVFYLFLAAFISASIHF